MEPIAVKDIYTHSLVSWNILFSRSVLHSIHGGTHYDISELRYYVLGGLITSWEE
jgi:hypothetical protein